MQLGLIGYYSDFVIYPLVIAVLAVAGLLEAGEEGAPGWIGTVLVCLFLWTLTEYVLHRFILHHIPYIKDLHDRHHVEERSSVGTPTWLSLGVHALVAFVPVWMVSGFATASGVSCGLMLGYLWYISIHHMIHHWHTTHPSYLYTLKRRHAVHHHIDESANFGVTSALWDRVFGTARL
ncbi:sterol desaturase family protein [Mesorhizobium sp. M0293]|uniref:sterol desaturase family protein n=1 Tax=unclassified Mesorhizobium TaxID=325217 RepID=UPI0033356730